MTDRTVPVDDLPSNIVPLDDLPVTQGEGYKGSPVRAGVVNFGATMAGLPMETVKNVANLGIAGYGTIKGAMGGDPPSLIENLPGDVANSRALLERLSKETNIPQLSPLNPYPESKAGTLAYDLASKGAFIPGAALPAVASEVGKSYFGPKGEIIGSIVPGAAGQIYSELRGPSLARQQARNTVRDESLNKAMDEGYVSPPSLSNPTFLGNRLESIAGKAAVKQEAEIKNQAVTDKLAAREVGLPEGSPITVQNLRSRRNELSEPYRQLAGLSDKASVFLDNLRLARDRANGYWEEYNRQGTVSSQLQAKQYDQKAQFYERALELEAVKNKRPDLVPAMKKARVEIAKTYEVQRALNPADGTVDARALAKSYAAADGQNLTGGLETIARFALGPGRQITRPSSLVPAPGVSALEPYGMAGLGLGGAGAGLGFWPAGLPLLRGPAREALLSSPYQNMFARPNYTPALTNPESPASLLPVLTSGR